MNTNLRTGVDMIEIDRIEDAINRQGQKFLKRVFTPIEILDCKERVESLAARFAAKEAVAKALGCGIGKVSWQEIEIIKNNADQPEIVLNGNAAALAESLKLKTWSVSLSHSKQYAIALVVALGEI